MPIAAAALVVATMFALAGCATHIGQAVDDATLAARVKTALVNDASVGAERIDVAVQAGVVTLSGTVSSDANRQRAIELARGVTGVAAVKSDLVTPPTHPSESAPH